jgi:hypothetical protein
MYLTRSYSECHMMFRFRFRFTEFNWAGGLLTCKGKNRHVLVNAELPNGHTLATEGCPMDGGPFHIFPELLHSPTPSDHLSSPPAV